MAKLDELFADRDLSDHMEVPVLLNTDAADRIAVAEHAVSVAQERHLRASEAEQDRMAKPRTAEATEALEAAKAELASAHEAALPHLVTFRFRSLGAQEWEDLVLAHPPTKKHREAHGRRLDFNPDTFPSEAIAACLVEVVQPDGTVETIDADADEINRTIKAKVKQAVWQQIWGATWRVNVGVSQVPPSLLGSSPTRPSGDESEQQ
jgi:hypothetical protein